MLATEISPHREKTAFYLREQSDWLSRSPNKTVLKIVNF
jgi:hypothetical protein